MCPAGSAAFPDTHRSLHGFLWGLGCFPHSHHNGLSLPNAESFLRAFLQFLAQEKNLSQNVFGALNEQTDVVWKSPLSSSLRGWVCTSPNIFPSATNHLFSLHGRFYFPLILDAVTRVFCIFFPKNCLAIFYSVRISYFSNVYTVQFLYEDFFLPRGKNAEGNV